MMQEDTNIWERQHWETENAYRAFQFYLTQTGKRTRTAAWLRFKPTVVKRKGRNAGKVVQNTSRPRAYFVHWSNGKKRNGVEIPDGKTWEERCSAYDQYVIEGIAKEERERAVKQLENLRKMQEDLHAKIANVIHGYQPSGESIGEITMAVTRLKELTASIYNLPLSPDSSIEISITDKERGKDMQNLVTTPDKIERLSSLLLGAKERKKEDEQ